MTPTDIVVRYLGLFETCDADGIAALVSPAFENDHTAALGSGCAGRDEYRRRLPGFIASMPGLRYEIEQVISQDAHVAVAYVLHAVVNDRPVAVRGMMRFEVSDGLITRRTDYWDSLVFQRQAGLA